MKKKDEERKQDYEEMKDYGVWVEVLGESPKNQILEFFLEGSSLDFPLGEISKQIELNRSTVYVVVEELVEKKIVTPTRKAAGAQMYQLNKESFTGKVLYEAYKTMLKVTAETASNNSAIA